MSRHGGTRVGSGRSKLSPEIKKKSYKVYMNIETSQQIELFGVGESFSSKVIDLVQSEIKNRSHIKEMRFIDLFAGIGGFRIALEEFGHKCVFSSEMDKYCQKVYEDNFKDTPSGDITQISENSIPDFDILTAGFPCQPFSYAGRQEGFNDKTRGTLFFDVLRIIKAKRPKMFLLENVKGLKSHNNGETMDIILSSLKELGYDVHWKILDSHKFGVPQKRERWYCVGFDKKVDFKFPIQTNPNTTLKDIVDVEAKHPDLELSEFEKSRIQHHFSSSEIRVPHDNSMYAPNTKKGKHGVFSFLKSDKTLRFHIGDAAKTQIQEAYYCSLDSVAPAIIAAREPKLWDISRRLSVDECRKLQGFPDKFIFNVSNLQAKKQLGNSVAVPVIREIVRNMLYYYK
ncbi:DNA cytosine methyltransferase [Acinetobacter sp. YH12058]|uniref:DNA cytosine methyltransferase n=1 Tax=Acinetobacter sp. YH12058 TaxID=2601058 RepID=UPI0015D2D890|nr:DNA cytosine methyltransferase [Acinetobacter sp. YH12058]